MSDSQLPLVADLCSCGVRLASMNAVATIAPLESPERGDWLRAIVKLASLGQYPSLELDGFVGSIRRGEADRLAGDLGWS